MRTNPLFILALVLFESAAAAWAAWEIWSIRQGKVEPGAKTDSSTSSDELPRHPEGEHGPDEG